MALQAVYTSGIPSGITPDKAVASALAVLNIYWNELQQPPLLGWEKWLKLFSVAMMVKHSTSLSELTPSEGASEC